MICKPPHPLHSRDSTESQSHGPMSRMSLEPGNVTFNMNMENLLLSDSLTTTGPSSALYSLSALVSLIHTVETIPTRNQSGNPHNHIFSCHTLEYGFPLITPVYRPGNAHVTVHSWAAQTAVAMPTPGGLASLPVGEVSKTYSTPLIVAFLLGDYQ